MEELGSMWSYQENIDELKQKLLYATIELESAKMEADEAMRKHREDVKNLINLLKIAYQERDEAKDQLQKLLNKLMPSSPTELQRAIPQIHHESQFMVPTKANSSITESNSPSETCNHQSHGSSPVDSFFDAVSSPDFSSINMADSSHMGFVNQPLVADYKGSVTMTARTDPANAVIDNLVKGKALPQKGKLLQSVMEAGPLLQTLLVAGPLPRWRNPPPLQPFKIPPVTIKVCEAADVNQKQVPNPKPLNAFPYFDMNRGSSQTCSASMLNFTNGPSCLSQSNGWPWLLNSGASISNQIPAGKRQRF